MQVVLDLDETLICAYETLSLPAAIRDRAVEAGLKWFDLECISSEKVLYTLDIIGFDLTDIVLVSPPMSCLDCCFLEYLLRFKRTLKESLRSIL